MYKTDKAITARIDVKNYNDNELLLVKVPLNMPYIINSDFERVDGQIEYKSIHYNYVKRKVSNDTLYLMCLPNAAKTQLAIAKSTLTKDANDIPANKKDAGSQVKKGGLIWEYNNIIAFNELATNITSTKQEHGFFSSKPACVFLPCPAQPPELI
jgi:hypothetical protein